MRWSATVEGFQVRVVEGRYAELLRSLREGDIDCLIGALRHPIPADDIEQELLFQDALAIVAHPSHPLVDQSHRSRLATPLNSLGSPPPKKRQPVSICLIRCKFISVRKSPVRVVSSSMAVLRGVLAEGPYVSIVSQTPNQPGRGIGHHRGFGCATFRPCP